MVKDYNNGNKKGEPFLFFVHPFSRNIYKEDMILVVKNCNNFYVEHFFSYRNMLQIRRSDSLLIFLRFHVCMRVL